MAPSNERLVAELRDLRRGRPDLDRATILRRYPTRRVEVEAALDALDAEAA